MDARPDDTQRYEPAPTVEEAPAADAAPTSRPANPGPSRARWLIGGGVAIAAVAVAILAVSMLGARPLAEALRYLPADTALVVEVRPDLPGDQRQHLGNFLAHFPGFDDQAILDDKIDEALERFVSAASDGEVDYRSQVKPILEGALVLGVSGDAIAQLAQEEEPTEIVSGLLLVATTDGTATCETVFDGGEAGGTHRDVALLSLLDGAMSCAVHAERYLLVGDTATVKAGLDARLDGSGIHTNDRYEAAHAALASDQLATFFVDGTAFQAVIDEAMGEAGGMVPSMPVPDWMAAGVRAEDDALVVDTASAPVPAPSGPSGLPTRAPAAESQFAGVLPPDTIALLEFRGVGAAVTTGLATLRADPNQAESLEQVEAALSMLGGVDNLTGWIEDLGVAVMPVDDGVGGAILFRGTDAEATAARASQVRNLLVLASTGTDITVRDADHGGVTVTTVDLGNLQDLIEGLGGMGVPGAELPTDVPADVRLNFSFAARDDILIVAFGDGVVESILDVDEAGSLKGSAAYARAFELAGATNQAQAYVAMAPLLQLLEGFAPREELDAYEADIKPYLEPLAGAAWSATADGASGRVRFVLTVK